MPVPLALAVPGAAVAFAYLNARLQLFYDSLLLRSNITATARIFLRERGDRVNLFYLLEDQVNSPSLANKTLFWFEDQTWTYRQTYDIVLKYGTWMRQELGVKPKDIVAVDFQNSQHFVFIWLGLWSIGARPAFINYNLSGAPLSHCLKVADTKVCIIDPHIRANVSSEVRAEHPGISFVDFDPQLEEKILSLTGQRAPDEDRSGQSFWDMATLIYTSGTTGLPKPAVVSWGKCMVGGTMASKLMGRGSDIMYTSMPLYHSSALVLSFVATIFSGSTQALGRKFSTKQFWPEVRRSGATNIQYVGETLRYLLASSPQIDPVSGKNLDREHNVKQAFGNGLRPDIWNKFKDRFGVETIVEFYAATEGPFGTWNVSRNDFTLGAMGRHGWFYDFLVTRAVKLIAMDEITQKPTRDPSTGFCKLAERNAPGEMIFRLPPNEITKRFQGYHNNSSATEAKMLRDVFTKDDVWFRTGDLARWNSEGSVYFHDRIGDTFRWKSENVSTAEVSQSLGLHPCVSEANVYGVELPHHDGRAGCAAVFLTSSPNATTMQSIGTHVRKTLPRYAQPIFLRVVKGMGVEGGQATGTNKQQKHALREAGVKPSQGKDAELGELFWLSGDSYMPFRDHEWKELEAGRVKL